QRQQLLETAAGSTGRRFVWRHFCRARLVAQIDSMPKRSRLKDFFWRHSAGIAFLVMLTFVAFLGFVGYTYVVITKKFESSARWDLPSRIYSDATQIVPGMGYTRALLEPKLNHVGYREVKKRVENPGEYRYVDDDLEIFLNNFEYPDMEFHAMPVMVEMDG